MIKKFTFLKLFLFTAFVSYLSNLTSQVSLTDSMSNVRVCFSAEENRLTFNVVTGSTGSYAEVKLPTGFTFEGFVNGSNTNGGSVTYAGLTAGYHRFNIANSTGGATVIVRFKQFARCGAGISTFTTHDSVRFFNGSVIRNFVTSSFNGIAPSLSITSITNTPSSVTVGSSVVRKYTVTNAGFGPTTDFLIVDKASSGQITINTTSFIVNPSGSNFSIPAASITTSGDSIKVSFLKALIANAGIGNGDSVFQNNESFELQYTLVANTCAIPTLTSQLLASWKCPNNASCNWFSVNTGLSTTGPAIPNIVFAERKTRRNDCFDGVTVWKDTLLIRNTGGAATDLVIDAGGTRGASFRADLPGAYMDTASLFYQIGKNGAKIKPSYTLIANITGDYSSLGCYFVGRPNQVRFTVPFLNANDTLYIFFGQVQCNYNEVCQVGQNFGTSKYFNGSGINFVYKNACGNATFNGGWVDAMPFRDHYVYGSNTGPLSIGDGETKDLSLDFDLLSGAYPNQFIFGNRAYKEVTITLPNVIKYDTAGGNKPVYFTNGVNTMYPYYRSANGDTFKFRFNNTYYSVGTQLHVKAKGVCDGVTCSGILFYKIQLAANPDTTGCNIENKTLCLDYPIAWTSSCTPICCPKGMVNLSYTLERKTLGLADDDNNGLPSGTLNKSLIKLDRVIPGDTVEFIHKFYLKTDTSAPQWDYVRSLMNVGTASWFSLVSDSVFVNRLVGTDSTFSMVPTAVGNDYITDLSFMPPFLNGDSVTVKLKLRVVLNAVASSSSFNSQVNGSASNDNFATNFSCGTFVQKLNLFSVDAFGYSTGIFEINGCNQLTQALNHYSRIGNGEDRYSNNKFPYEYRLLNYPTKMHYKLPPNYIVDSLEFITYNYPSQPLSGTYPTKTNIPFTIDNDTLKFRVGQLFTPEGGNIIPPEEGHYNVYYLFLTPTCKTTNAVTQYVSYQDSFKFNSQLDGLATSAYTIGTTKRAVNAVGYANFHPNIILSSSTPISTAYTKNVSWPLSINSLSAFSTPHNWLYITKPSGLTNIDSLKEGSTLYTPDANGFYRISTINGGATRNFTIFGNSTACNFDSILVYPGYACGGFYPTSFSAATCSKPPIALYVQPQPAAIQTQIKDLLNTPSDPSNASSPIWGSSTVTNCNSFPVEMEIQSTLVGTIFQVKELALLPFNAGNTGVDLLMDSVYVEYPIGTTPRKASFIGRALMQSTVSSGSMELDLEKLDSINFSTNKGLPGTGLGTGTTRLIKIRWKMKTNCDIISGSQWNARQKANAPCGSVAQGDNTITSGFPIEIGGIIKPYVANTTLTPKVGGCSSGNCDTTILRIQKIGAGVSTNDSIFIKIPTSLTLGSIYCSGVNCPGGVSGTIPASSIKVSSIAGDKVYTFEVPNEFDNNNDTLNFKIQAFEPNKASCGTSSSMEAGVRIPVTLQCLGTPCPGSNASLGSKNEAFDVNKPVIVFSAYTGLSYAPYTGPNYTYSYTLDVLNSGKIKTNNNMVFKTYFDKNVNGTFEPLIDSLADTYTYPSSIEPDSTKSIFRSFTGVTFPSQFRPMFTIIDTAGTNNCMCAPIVQSSMFVGLPIDIIGFNSTASKCANIIKWQANTTESTMFEVEKSINGSKWASVYTTQSQVNSNLQSYSFTDLLPNTVNFYRLKLTSLNGKINYTKAITANAPCINNPSVISLQPNPIQSGNLQVSVLVQFDENVEVQILDVTGKVVFTKNVKLTEGSNQIYVPFDTYAEGVYTFKTKINGEIQLSKFVKVN